MTLRLDLDGTVTAIYGEELDLRALGAEPRIRRASNVEPTPDGRWTADLAPVGGGVLGPYELRSEALAAEVAWLERALCAGAVLA